MKTKQHDSFASKGRAARRAGVKAAIVLLYFYVSCELTLFGMSAQASVGLLQRVPSRERVEQTVPRSESGRRRVSDLLMLTQDGKKVRFYSDLVKGRVVVINFFYTTCTSTCLSQAEDIYKLRQILGGRGGKDMFLISVSIDPSNDSPKRLKAWGKKFQAVRPGWTLITGNRENTDRLLVELLGYNPTIDQHGQSAVFLIGNDRSGSWEFVSALEPIEDIANRILSTARSY
jgi:protein SCO1